MDRRRNPLKRSALLAMALLCATATAGAADVGSLWPQRSAAADELLPVDQAFVLVSAERKHDRIEVSWSIAPGYYLYRRRLGFAAEPAAKPQTLGTAQLPAGTTMHDEQGDNEIYRGNLLAVVPLRGAAPAQLRVRYQGCADAGVCYPPQSKLIDVVSTPQP